MSVRRGRHLPARDGGGRSGGRRTLFDVAAEEPELVEADREVRSRRRGGAGGPAIDPRIAARRAEVEAAAAAGPARRRRRLAATAIGVVVVTGSAALALLSPLASVRRIEVVRSARTPAADVRAASGLAGVALVRVDKAATSARIESMPWVLRARLERRWPSTVVIHIDERRPAALAPCGGGTTCLIDASGRVLAPSGDDAEASRSVPLLSGVPDAGDPGEMLPESARGPLAVAVALPPALRPLVAVIRRDGAEVALDLRAAGRQASPPVVRLGAPERLSDKLTAAATVLARTSVNGVAVLDVRVPESPALTRPRR